MQVQLASEAVTGGGGNSKAVFIPPPMGSVQDHGTDQSVLKIERAWGRRQHREPGGTGARARGSTLAEHLYSTYYLSG